MVVLFPGDAFRQTASSSNPPERATIGGEWVGQSSTAAGLGNNNNNDSSSINNNIHGTSTTTDLVNCSRRYVPKVGDLVLGVIVGKTADFFRVDIKSFSNAVLPTIAFNGATKRNRPNLQVFIFNLILLF